MIDASAWGLLGDGFVTTLKLVAVSAPITIVAALGLAAARVSGWRTVRGLSLTVIELLRNVPLLALLIVVYFAIGPMIAHKVSVFWIAAVVLSVNQAAYLAEVYRGAISQLPLSQWESGASLGLSRRSCLVRVIGPQAAPPAIPATVNAVIYLVKDSALASLISVNELTAQVQQNIQMTFEPLLYLLVGLVLYLLINIPLAYLGRWLEWRVAGLLGVINLKSRVNGPKLRRFKPGYTDVRT